MKCGVPRLVVPVLKPSQYPQSMDVVSKFPQTHCERGLGVSELETTPETTPEISAGWARAAPSPVPSVTSLSSPADVPEPQLRPLRPRPGQPAHLPGHHLPPLPAPPPPGLRHPLCPHRRAGRTGTILPGGGLGAAALGRTQRSPKPVPGSQHHPPSPPHRDRSARDDPSSSGRRRITTRGTSTTR